jgi:hypothetical protein
MQLVGGKVHCVMKSRKRVTEIQEGPDAATRFEHSLDRVLRVSKTELERRETAYRETRKDKPRRGPKPPAK